MQADVTRQSFGWIILQFFALAALFWASCYYGDGSGILPGFEYLPAPVQAPGEVIPGSYIGNFTARYPAATGILSLLLLFSNAFLITKAVSRNLVYTSRTYLPCIFYMLVGCSLCFPGYDLAAVLAAYFMVRASIAFISSFVRSVSFGTTFKGAFLVGVTPLLEPQNAVYILLVPVAMAVFRRTGRETVVAVIGSLIPTLLTAYIWWAAGSDFTGIFVRIWYELTAGIPEIFTGAGFFPGSGTFADFLSTPAGAMKLAGIVLMAVLLMLAIVTLFFMSSDMRTRAYKINVFALWFLLFAVISILLPSRACGNFPVLAIPASIIIPAFFIRHRTAIPLTLYILTLATLTIANLLPILAGF